jgi:hypothetical protein
MKPTTLSLAWRSGCLDLRVAVGQGKAIARDAIRAMALSFPGASRCSGVKRRRRRCPAACYVIRGVRVARAGRAASRAAGPQRCTSSSPSWALQWPLMTCSSSQEICLRNSPTANVSSRLPNSVSAVESRVASLARVTRINLAASPESTTCTFGRAAARARSVLPQADRRWRSGGCAAPHLRTGWTRALQMRIT